MGRKKFSFINSKSVKNLKNLKIQKVRRGPEIGRASPIGNFPIYPRYFPFNFFRGTVYRRKDNDIWDFKSNGRIGRLFARVSKKNFKNENFSRILI